MIVGSTIISALVTFPNGKEWLFLEKNWGVKLTKEKRKVAYVVKSIAKIHGGIRVEFQDYRMHDFINHPMVLEYFI